MLLIPAIDLKDGKCVRLRQGSPKEVILFSTNPLKIAAKWVDAGSTCLHIIDLDGAFQGKPRNMEVIRKIVLANPDCRIQVGGGIRCKLDVEKYLDMGVDFVILGTKAVEKTTFIEELCEEFVGHIIVGLDYRNNKVAIGGWKKSTSSDLHELAKRFDKAGVAGLLHTDILRDGMMTGPNLCASKYLACLVKTRVIVAGGFSTMKDIEALTEESAKDLGGAVLGRALYEGTIDLAASLRMIDDAHNLSRQGSKKHTHPSPAKV